MNARIILAVSLGLAGCGGGATPQAQVNTSADPPSPTPQVVNQDPEGLWESGNGLMLVTASGVMIYTGPGTDPTGQGILSAVGQLTVEGSAVTGPQPSEVTIFSPDACPWDVCSASPSNGLGALEGSVQAQSSFTLNGISFTFDALYNQPSSPEAIAGDWQASFLFDASSTLDSVEITPEGTLSANAVLSACALSGQIEPIDPQHNAYSVSLSYTNCTSGFALEVNGLQGQGLGYLDTTQEPEVLDVLVEFEGQFIGDYKLELVSLSN